MAKLKRRLVPPKDASKKPSRIIVESSTHESLLLIVRNAQGVICKPWAILEASKIKGRGGRMEFRDRVGLKNHQSEALSEGQEMAKELALEEQQEELL